MAFKPTQLSWHGYIAGAAAVMAGVAAVQKKWTSVLIEGAMCIFFFAREAQIQRARRRSSDGNPNSRLRR
jgi:hypothetical protein